MMQTTKQRLRGARFRSKLLRRPLVRSRHKRLTPRDAFLASYPRSGTTWLRFLLYESLTGEAPEFGSIRAAVPSVGKQRGARPVLVGGGRLVQTHETYSHGDRLVVYVVRDPRRVALSEYYWQKRNRTYDSSLAAFVEDFCRGRSNPWGSWGAHVEYRRGERACLSLSPSARALRGPGRDTFDVCGGHDRPGGSKNSLACAELHVRGGRGMPSALSSSVFVSSCVVCGAYSWVRSLSILGDTDRVT
jgi:hypothetical protein